MKQQLQTAALPDFFIALVLHDAQREPTSQEYDGLREQTISFWTKRLKKVYDKEANKDYTFEGLDLSFNTKIYGSKEIDKHDQNDLDNPFGLTDEFNVFVEVSGTVAFHTSHYTKSAPNGDDVFREMISGDSMDYLTGHVRKQSKDNLFGTCVEVIVKRLHVLADNNLAGGVVQAPSFFIAFSTDGTYDKPPTSKQIDEYQKRTHALVDENLRKEYPDKYESCNLIVTTSEMGLSKPSPQFQLYIENDLSATFHKGPLPTPNELFAIIMKCATIDSNRYLTTITEIDDGGPFETITMCTIQLIGLEMPEEPEELQDQEKEQDSGSEGEQDGNEDEDIEEEVVEFNVPIFLALVVNAEPPAKLPTPDDLGDFTDLMERFFYTTLRKEYPGTMIDIKMKEKTTEYNSGYPEERFNMCTEYDAKIRFKKNEDTPDDKMLRGLVLNVNLSSILAHVQRLKPLCFQGCTEVSMKKKSEQQDEADTSIPDPTFQAGIERPVKPPPREPSPPPLLALPPPEPKVEKVKPKAKPKPKTPKPKPPPPQPPKDPTPEPEPPKKVEIPKPKPNPKAKKENPKPKPPKPAPVPQDEAPRTPEQPRRRLNMERPKERLSLNMPSPKRGPLPRGELVESSDVYVALTVKDLKISPTEEEYELLRESTEKFFKARLKEVFPKQFVSMDLGIRVKEFGASKPSEKYNVYVEWIIQARFASLEAPSSPVKLVEGKRGSVAARDNTDMPGPVELTQAIVKNIDLIDYLMNYCQALGPPFDFTMGGFIQQRIAGVNM